METFDIYWFEQNYSNGECCIENEEAIICMYEWNDSYSIQTEHASPDMICSLKRFFADTLTLMEEGFYLKHGHVKIGVWKKYDRSGNVVDEKDYDEGWCITWEKLIPFIHQQGIKMGGIVKILRDEKKKNEEDEDSASNMVRTWVIGQITMSDGVFEFHFDGDTGRLINKIQLPPSIP